MASISGTPVVPTTTDPSAPIRIKRNTACIRCRDAKVKCNANLNPSQACLRCAKLGLDCVVDKGHKRSTKRSKLEELAAEIRHIKEAVASAPSATISPTVAAPPLRPSRPQGHPVRELPYISAGGPPPTYSTPPMSNPSFRGGPMAVETQTESPGVSNFTTWPRAAGQVAEPRALASRVFSGQDIEHYFDKYFEDFHPFMPIVRIRDPDACYKAAPVLFWTIIVTSCRRYAKREGIFQFLVSSLSSEVWSAVASPPVPPPVITALVILSTWSLPNIRFMSDPTYIYSGIAMNSCLYLGLHTGKGIHPEFSGPTYEAKATDEEATYLWAATNIISQRTSSCLGYPPTAPFTGKALHGVMGGTSPYSVPRSFATNLAAARYSNGLLKAIAAGLEDGPGISYHLVEQMEDDFVKLQRSLHDGTPDIDDFMLRSTLLEVQMLYWMPLSRHSDEALQRNLVRTFGTCEGLIKLALDLERKSRFLSHAPHHVFRSLLLAACSIISYLRSPFPGYGLVPPGAADTIVRDAILSLKTCSVQPDDLPMRGANIMEAYWSVRDRLPPQDTSQLHTANFKHRLGPSIVYDCLGRWKKDLEWTRTSAAEPPPAKGPAEAFNSDATLATEQNPDLGLTDPLFRGIDWGSFVDDFEWNFPPSLGDLDRQPTAR